MRLYLSVKTNISDAVIDVLEVLLTDGTEFSLDCEETFYERNPQKEKLNIEMSGLSCFDEDTVCLNGKCKIFKDCCFTICQVYSESNLSDIAYFSIERIALEDGDSLYEMPQECIAGMEICDESGNNIRKERLADIP